ncbi:hypothetical protein BDW22DRAFT_1351396 [Trametopsis cervina]|nr:hypothetical protein BDW22DRAFT_1351396 [Trametopsis cervina]
MSSSKMLCNICYELLQVPYPSPGLPLTIPALNTTVTEPGWQQSASPNLSNTDGGEVGRGRTQGNERKHICEVCNKPFSRPSALATHMNSHTGDRPFKCPFPGCVKEFSARSNMRRHFAGHERSSGPALQTVPYQRRS